MGLSELQISRAKPTEKPYKLSDSGGLHLLVKPIGSKLCQQRFRFLGKEKLLSLGKYPEIGLSKAREKRDKARAMLAEGTDPASQKKLGIIKAHIAHRTTFKLSAEEYLDCPGSAPMSQN